MLLLRTDLVDATDLRDRLRAAWEASRAPTLALATVVAVVDDDAKPAQVLRAAEAALEAPEGARDLVLDPAGR